MILRPHDLLRVTDSATPSDGAPAWVRTALARTPWVVVRRSEAPRGFVAVGVRGSDRSHRHALTLPYGDVGEVVAPESLTAVGGARDVPAVRALAEARMHLDDCAMPWGPTGSVGFELATGAPTATWASDLDLLVRAPVLTPRVVHALRELHERLRSISVHVDCQVETADGAIALAELASDSSEVLVKTTAGARLVPIVELLA